MFTAAVMKSALRYEQVSFQCSDSRYIIIITCTYKINTVM